MSIYSISVCPPTGLIFHQIGPKTQIWFSNSDNHLIPLSCFIFHHKKVNFWRWLFFLDFWHGLPVHLFNLRLSSNRLNFAPNRPTVVIFFLLLFFFFCLKSPWQGGPVWGVSLNSSHIEVDVSKYVLCAPLKPKKSSWSETCFEPKNVLQISGQNTYFRSYL